MNNCPRYDFVTQQKCVLEKDHEGYHRLADGTAFAIGYTDEDVKEWEADSEYNAWAGE